jgi:hypothetical protein
MMAEGYVALFLLGVLCGFTATFAGGWYALRRETKQRQEQNRQALLAAYTRVVERQPGVFFPEQRIRRVK